MGHPAVGWLRVVTLPDKKLRIRLDVEPPSRAEGLDFLVISELACATRSGQVSRFAYALPAVGFMTAGVGEA